MSEHPKEYHYFLDAQRYTTDHKVLSGAVIKKDAKPQPIPDAYQLFLEEEGDKPDKPIADSENVDLAERIKHFYAVPPATFGQR
jgi:hypothetical protein